MEYRLILDDNEETLGNFSLIEILPLTNALKKSLIFDKEGNVWTTDNFPQLYFNIYPPYFYLSLSEPEDASG